MDPAIWKMQWGEDRLLYLPAAHPALPAAANNFLQRYGLPWRVIFEGQRVIFEVGFDCVGKSDFKPYNTLFRWGDFYNAQLDAALGHEIRIGEEDFCNGSASWCVHHDTGEVKRLDIELSNPICFANASVETLARCLLVAVQWSQRVIDWEPEKWRASIAEFEQAIREIDPAACADPKNFWPMFLEELLSNDEETGPYRITTDPASSKLRF